MPGQFFSFRIRTNLAPFSATTQSEMDDARNSNTFVFLKRRITEIDETLQQQPQSSSDYPSSSIIPEESKPSKLLVSTPKEEQESMRNSPNFFKKVKCSANVSECTISEAQELGFEENGEMFYSVSDGITVRDIESGSCGSQKKIGNFGTEFEKNENRNVGLVSDGGLKIEEVEDVDNGVKEEKDCVESEVGFSGIQEFCNEVVSGEKKAEEKEKCEGKVEMNYSVEGHKVEGCVSSSLAALAEEEELLIRNETESGSTLEAKKKQVLTENRINVRKVAGSESISVKNDVYKAIDVTAGCSIKIAIIDDTALIDAVQVRKNGNANGKNVERNGKKNEKEDGFGKKPRRSRKKAKDSKMGSEMRVGHRYMTHFVVPQKDGNELKRMYSREKMEALRFANIFEWHLVWREIYTGLSPALVKEYDELARMKHQKNIQLNVNPGQNFGRKTEVPALSVLGAN